MSKRNRHTLDPIWERLSEYFPVSVKEPFLHELQKTWEFEDPIVPVNIFSQDPTLCPLLTVQGPYVHCSILKAIVAGQSYALVKQNNDLRYIYDIEDTTVKGKAIKFYPENPSYFSVLQTEDRTPVGVQTVYDRYGRIVRQFHQNDIVAKGSYKNVLWYEYVHEKVNDLLECIPDRMYRGEMKNYMYHGVGTLYSRNHLQGFYIEKRGTFKDHILQEGKTYYHNRNVSFEGTFENGIRSKGIAYHANGRISWEGSFLEGLPHGDGRGFLSENTLFEGIMNKGSLASGSVFRNSRKGLILDSKGTYVNSQLQGYGVLFTETRHFEGYFSNGIPTVALETPLSKGDCLSQRFDHMPVLMYSGSYTHKRTGSSVLVWNGLGAMLFKTTDQNDIICYVKFVGQFVQGKRNGLFKIYRLQEDTLEAPTAETQVPNYYDGEFIGSALYNMDIPLRAIQIYENGEHVYSGSGDVYLCGAIEDLFIRDGRGTCFANGRTAYDALFEDNIVQNVYRLYDEQGSLLFESDEEPADNEVVGFVDNKKRWPKLNSMGVVYGANGTPLYHGTFAENELLNAESVLNLLPVVPYSSEEPIVDYITLSTIRKGQYAVAFNDETLQYKNFVSQATFLKLAEESLKDPLKGSYPGYRFTRVKIE